MARNLVAFLLIVAASTARAVELEPQAVEGQPLAANVLRIVQALEDLGRPLPTELTAKLREAAQARNARQLQALFDKHVVLTVDINPESRVKVARGPGLAQLQQGAFVPLLVKVHNLSTVTAPLKITSPQAGAVYGGEALNSLRRQGQTELQSDPNATDRTGRFLNVAMFQSPPLAAKLSGLEVEYAVALIYCAESGRRDATIAFDVGQGTQDLGFRAEASVLFDVQPALPVRLTIRDFDGQPTTARLEFRDGHGHILPPQPLRLAPDLFFQRQIYRHDGEVVLLPPGKLTLESSRGPEYKLQTRDVTIPTKEPASLEIKLERWVNPQAYGFLSGDHHIHAAGCAHYVHPTEGVHPPDMFRQVKGEGLNVGCILTWGPCYDFQRRFFKPGIVAPSEPLTVIKYDVEVSGFGSQALGHVCLLNLQDQSYPGTNGTSHGWPTWTVPVLRWTKEQGGVTGYAHSASGIQIDAAAAAARQLAALDRTGDKLLVPDETIGALLTEPFADIDANQDGHLSLAEITGSHDRVAHWLPNYAIPEMNGVGAMETCVTTALGLCDFISAMDTVRIQEWNTWYHLMNCGFPLAVSGETDFPCMSSTRVGQGRVYVQSGQAKSVDYGAWCRGLAEGRSYVSDGFAHALQFQISDNGPSLGGKVELPGPGKVPINARVVFSSRTPETVAHGLVTPLTGRRAIGDTVVLYPDAQGKESSPQRLVELIVNGKSVATRTVPADDAEHDLTFEVDVQQSSWIARRQFPQLHTNPIRVIVDGKPIRASRRSALWCIGVIEQLWRNRKEKIAETERAEAERAYEKAKTIFRNIAAEASGN